MIEGEAATTSDGDSGATHVSFAHPPAARPPPSAEGYGAYAIGGRRGHVLPVTNVNDAVLASGLRVVIFRVREVIHLKSDIVITEPFLTIAGQTAPGDGIVLGDRITGYGSVPP